MSQDLVYWIPLALLYLVTGGAAFCTYPGDVTDATFMSQTSQTTYTEGDMILYECERAGGGHVARFCNADDTWTDASRACHESIIWDSGALGGVVMAGFTYFVAIFAIIYSKIKFPKSEDSEEDKDKDKAKDTKTDDKSKDGKDKKQEPVTSNGTK